MALTDSQFLEAMYVAFCNRAADPSGYSYWSTQHASGVSFANIGDNFAMSTEGQNTYAYFKAYYQYGAASLTDDMRTTFIDQVYQNLLGRAADTEGKAYWLAQLKSGASTPGQMLANMIYSASLNAGTDPLTVTNKANAALNATNYMVSKGTTWTAQLSTSISQILATVTYTSDMTAVNTAVDAKIDIATGYTQSFALSALADYADTTGYAIPNTAPLVQTGFKFTAGNEMVSATNTTLTAGDVLLDNATGDSDVLNLTLTGTIGAPAVTLQNIETLNINAALTAAAAENLSFASVTGMKTVNVSGTSTALNTINLGNGAALATSTGITTVNASGLTGGLGNITVSFAGNTNSVTVTGSEGGDTIVGAAAASKLSGGLGADNITGGAAADTIDGGAGNDTLAGAGGNDTITGGDGNDIITGGGGLDTLSGGSGTNTFNFAQGDTGAPSPSSFDNITDWTAGSNKIADTSAAISLHLAVVGALNVAAVDATGVATFGGGLTTDNLDNRITAVNAALDSGVSAAGQAAVFAYGGDSYLYITDGVAGVSSSDILVKLTGYNSVTPAVGITVTAGVITSIA